MSRTKKFVYNSATTALYQIILMVSGFITVSVVLKSYGSEVNGLVSSINQFIVYFKLVEAGLSSAAIYALYKPLAINDYKAINEVVVAAKKIYTKSGYVFLLLTIGLALFYPMFLTSDSITPLTVGILVLILGVNGALEFFTLAKYRALLTADQKTYVISIASIIYVIANTFIIVFLANLMVNIITLWLVSLISVILRTLILLYYVKKRYKWINYKEKPNFNALNQRWDALYLQILGAIHVGSSIVILTVITKDMKLVSIYSVFYMIIIGLNGILSIFKTGLFASFGDVIAKGEVEILQKAYKEFEYFYYSLIAIVFSISFVMILPFIRIFTKNVTDINYDLPLIGVLFVLNGLLYNIKTPQGMLVISAGLFKETKLQTTIQGAVVIIVGIILTPTLGIVGVLIASIISNIYRSVDLLFFIPKKVTKLPVKDTLYRMIRAIISVVVIWAPFWFININPTNYVSWFAYASAIGTYALFVVVVMGYMYERENLLSTVERIFKMVKR
ncbi:O-antigen/teichoic acid export membrane protein [Paenibacillus endophyticus]|uniref:O-antigen/teichoic acid export membrane protein n=1 Tax=Paenibacillus endophyticus TaxID=1294268 RepID=A0A7W5C8Z9_9BACL|nr:hypothetical protein [Paenibacillus endophyticus]MBB3153302.1 O-antigen/teichoic acid export membrane protein [Paenibacillus endophyticus]